MKFKSASANPQVASSTLRVASLNPRVPSLNPRVTSSNPPVQESFNQWKLKQAALTFPRSEDPQS